MKSTKSYIFYSAVLSGLLMSGGCGQDERSTGTAAEHPGDKIVSCSGVDKKQVQLVHSALAAFNKKIDGNYGITKTKDGYYPVIPDYPSSKLLLNPEALDDDPINEKMIAIIKDATSCDMAETTAAYEAFKVDKEAYSKLFYLRNRFKDESHPQRKQVRVAASESPIRFMSLSASDADLDNACAMAVKNDKIADDTVLMMQTIIVTPKDDLGPYEFSVRLCDKKPYEEKQSDNFQEAPESEEEGQFEPWPKLKKSGCNADECRI